MFQTSELMFRTFELKFRTFEHKFNSFEHRFLLGVNIIKIGTESFYS